MEWLSVQRVLGFQGLGTRKKTLRFVGFKSWRVQAKKQKPSLGFLGFEGFGMGRVE